MEELLHKAIENGDEKRVRHLIQKGAAMDKLMGLRGTALCAAISDNQTTIAFYLIDTGCDVNGEDYDREPPLLLAMRKERFEIVKKMIGHPRCLLNKPDDLTKLTPLCFAAKSGQTEVVDWLVNAGCHLTGKDADGNSALHLAIENSNYDIVQRLVQIGSSLIELNDEGFAPIHTLAKKGDCKSLVIIMSKWVHIENRIPQKFFKLYISEKVQPMVMQTVNSVTKYGHETPLILAATRGHSDLIKLLLMCGANPNVGDHLKSDLVCEDGPKIYISTPIARLCSSYQKGEVKLDVFTWLLDAGCRVDQSALVTTRMERLDMTPLQFAAKYDLLDLSKLLVSYGADVNLRKDINDNTPLYVAIINNSERVMWYFLKECSIRYENAAGVWARHYFHAAVSLPEKCLALVLNHLRSTTCNVNGIDDHHKTALFLGIEKQNLTFVRNILDLHADVTICNKYLDSPLHKCAEIGSVEITKLLLAHGAEVNKTNSRQMIPLDIALEDMEDKDHKEIAILLLQNGSRVSSMASNILKDEEKSDNSKFYIDSDDDNDSDSLLSTDSEDNGDLDGVLKQLLSDQRDKPVSLYMLTVATIRSHFRNNSLPFSGMSSLPLPKIVINRILLN